MLKYIEMNQDKYIKLVLQHLELTIMALLISIILGILIGFSIYKNSFLSAIATGITGSFRVVPSLVLMLVFMPWLGTGKLPAILSLVLIGLPPILANTITGLLGTPSYVIEGGMACGMNERQLFSILRLPLALPTIVTGIRMSSLSIAAGATLAAYIGAGGLGEFILSGISQYRVDIMLAGSVTIMVICLLLEIVFQLLYLHVSKFRRRGVLK